MLRRRDLRSWPDDPVEPYAASAQEEPQQRDGGFPGTSPAIGVSGWDRSVSSPRLLAAEARGFRLVSSGGEGGEAEAEVVLVLVWLGEDAGAGDGDK